MRLFVAISLVMFCGCGGGGGDSASDLGSATVSFAHDVKPILTNSGCLGHHMTAAWDGVNTLASDADIVHYFTSTNAKECGGSSTLVKAGDSAHSYLYQKIAGTFDAACTMHGGQMPLGGAPLPASALATVKSWIDAGAPIN